MHRFFRRILYLSFSGPDTCPPIHWSAALLDSNEPLVMAAVNLARVDHGPGRIHHETPPHSNWLTAFRTS
jgi:hypothetical protein